VHFQDTACGEQKAGKRTTMPASRHSEMHKQIIKGVTHQAREQTAKSKPSENAEFKVDARHIAYPIGCKE